MPEDFIWCALPSTEISPSTATITQDLLSSQPTPSSPMPTIIKGKAAMLAPGSNCVPRTFEGREEDIAEFLEQFENCADNGQLPPSEKVLFLFQYLSRQQRDVFKMFNGYSTATWNMFKTAIEEALEGAFKEKKYT